MHPLCSTVISRSVASVATQTNPPVIDWCNLQVNRPARCGRTLAGCQGATPSVSATRKVCRQAQHGAVFKRLLIQPVRCHYRESACNGRSQSFSDSSVCATPSIRRSASPRARFLQRGQRSGQYLYRIPSILLRAPLNSRSTTRRC